MASSLLSQLALVTGGVLAGFALGYTTLRTWSELKSTSFALYKITQAKTVPIYDLRSLIASSANDSESSNKTFVVVHGVVQEAKSRNWTCFTSSNVLVSPSSGEKGVILEETQAYLTSNDVDNLMNWDRMLPAALRLKSWNYQKCTSIQTVPFILAGSGQEQNYDPVIVDLDGSTHSLPLTTVYHKVEDLLGMSDVVFPYTFLEALLFPCGRLQEKILPLGKEINAFGLCSLQDGNLHIKATEELPCFLSEMTKDEMVEHLACKTTILFLGGCIIGIMSLGVLGYTSFRIWKWCKGWRRLSSNDEVYEGIEAIPSEQLCPI